MSSTLKTAVAKFLNPIRASGLFTNDQIFLSFGDFNAPLPIMVWDITDVEQLDTVANPAFGIAILPITIQIFGNTDEQVIDLVDSLHKVLQAAKLVKERNNIFSTSEDFTPQSTNNPQGLIRLIVQYRIQV